MTFAADGGTTAATLPAIPTGTAQAVLRSGHIDSPSQLAALAATPAWIARTSATALAIDGSAPGFDAAWKVAPATATYQELELDIGASFGVQETAVYSGTPLLDVPRASLRGRTRRPR